MRHTTLFLMILIIPLCLTANDLHKSETEESLNKRQKEEKITEDLQHSFSVHKPFYLLPLTYNFSPNKSNLNNLTSVDNLEVKFQFSFKFNIIDNFINDHFQLSFSYTNLSFWQLYNNSNSAAFRETNHEPEIFIAYRPKGNLGSVVDDIFRMGFVHQSNGQNVPQSRSWNRVYVQGIFNMNFAIASLKIWHRIKESSKATPLSPAGDDNPDIQAYLGDFELNLIKKIDDNTLSLLLRNNLRKDNRGALQVSWSFPMSKNFRGYLQYFNGYGESLIDYNSPVQRVGLGLLIGDWI